MTPCRSATPPTVMVLDADIFHAWANAIRLVEYEYDGDKRLL